MADGRTTSDAGRVGNSFAPKRVELLLSKFGTEWLASARRQTRNASDAEDLFQRAMEILIDKAPGLPDDQIAAWVHVVIKNEAISSHRRRRHETEFDFAEIVDALESQLAIPEDRLIETEELQHGKRAIRRLRTEHARCLLLRADGFDYAEICKITGFSYTKVNRYLSEGRKALRLHLGSIESGADCDRYLPMLSMIADGEASELSRVEADLHLRDCLFCQATLREYIKTPERVRSVFPFAPFAVVGVFRDLRSSFESAHAWVNEKIASLGPAIQFGTEATTAKRVGGGALASIVLLAGGAAIHSTTFDAPDQAQPESSPSSQTLAAEPSRQIEQAARDRRAAAKARARRAVRNARESDVFGKRAGTSTDDESSSSAADEGSAPEGDRFNPPPADNSSTGNNPPSSRGDYSDLEP